MENKSYLQLKAYATKAGRRFLALVLACGIMFGLSACGGQKPTGKAEEIKPVAVEREPEPPALQTVSEATAIALTITPNTRSSSVRIEAEKHIG